MMKVMRRQGCVDSTLKQQVEQLLSDAALQDYTAAFTPGIITNTGDYSAGFTQRFISNFQDYTSGFTPDQTCPAVFTPANLQTKSGFTPESGVKGRDSISERHVSISAAESSTNLQVTSAATATLKRNDNSPAPTAPPALTESLITKALQVTY